MNWSRAKSILIVALLVTNLILLGTYYSSIKAERVRISEATKSSIQFLQRKGVAIKCDVPEEVQRIPVINVHFIKGNSAGGVSTTTAEDIPLEIIGINSLKYVDYIKTSGDYIYTLPAYSALLKSYGSISGDITNVELIYLVDRSAYPGEGGEDTALPYWKISSSDNSYYYSAFAE